MRKRWKAARIISIALVAILVISHTAMSFASTGALETGGQPAAAGQNASEVNKIQGKSETGVPEETMMPPSSSESNMSEEESDYLQAIDNASSESENKAEGTSDNEDRIPADKVNSKATSGEKAQELTLDKEKLSIQVGNTGSLKATAETQDASLKWKSDNKKVAEVSNDGTVTGVGIGTATITVSSGNLSAKAIVTVSRNTSNDVEQDAYFYIRKPDASEGATLADTWYYAGMGKVKAPTGTGEGQIYEDLSMITKYPESYPVITANGQEYTYDDSKTPAPNTYSIEWEYIKDETGANKGYEQLTDGQAYHVDGHAVFNFEFSATGYKDEYDGEFHEATIKAPSAAKVEYFADGHWTTSAPTIKDVGKKTYKVRATLYGSTKEAEFILEVTSKAVTVKANNQSKVYGTADPEFEADVKGTIGDDTVKYQLSRAEGEDVGTYEITASGEENQGNYKVTYEKGTLTITPAPLQIIANNANKVQGTENPKFSAQIAGLLGDDDKGALEGEMMFECSADKDSPIGEYIIIPYGLTAENYDIEYVTGVLSITLTPEPPAPPTAPTITVPVYTPPTTPNGMALGTPGGTAPAADGNNANAALTAAAGTAAPLVTIDEGEVPMAAGNGNAHWALLNLILTVLTALMSIVLIALYFTKRREREDEAKIVEQQQEERGLKKKGVPRILSAVWAVLMIVVFFLTEDMDLPMQLTDKWTIIMAIMTIVQIVIAFFAKKKYGANEKDNDLAQA